MFPSLVSKKTCDESGLPLLKTLSVWASTRTCGAVAIASKPCKPLRAIIMVSTTFSNNTRFPITQFDSHAELYLDHTFQKISKTFPFPEKGLLHASLPSISLLENLKIFGIGEGWSGITPPPLQAFWQNEELELLTRQEEVNGPTFTLPSFQKYHDHARNQNIPYTLFKVPKNM